MGDDGGGGEKKAADPRVDLLVERIIGITGCKPESAARVNDDEKSVKAMMAFFDDPDERLLFIYQATKESWTCSRMPPPNFKMKCLYMQKTESSLSAETFAQTVFGSEFFGSPLEQLLTVAQEVYFPLLTNPRNQEGWPEVITKEVTESLHRFLAQVYITIGNTMGKTLLPLPPNHGAALMDAAGRDKDRIHVLESAVVMWTRQIKNILKMDPETALKSGNPGPEVELEFWKNKAENLNSLHLQLSGEKIRKVVKVLEVTKSTYFPAFNRLCKEVAQARMEANDNIVYLEPMVKYVTQLAADSFSDLIPLFKPTMHTLLLIWKNSKFYNTPARLVVIMRELCNTLIMQACNFVSGESLFENTDEPQEAVDNLKQCLKVCVTFKSTYFDYKARAGVECPSNPWRFQNSALFARLDSFLERCHDVLDLMQTILQFNKLGGDKGVEIGGTKGKSLTQSVRQTHQDFLRAIKVFVEAEYNIMDVDSKQFDDDFYTFRCQINELERRLASVITQAFDDSVTVLGRFKLLDSFEGLLEREIIQTDLEKKNADLLNAYALDLKQVQEIFVLFKDGPPINDNAPPRAGAVMWVQGLMERVQDPMNRLKNMGKAILDSEEGKECMRAYTAILASLQEYERQHREEWALEIENTSAEKLKQSLLRRDASTAFVYVNFDPALVCLLRETKYFLLMKLEIPESAASIFDKAEVYRQHTGYLDLIVNIYNHILETVLPVERPLVQFKLDNIDKVLLKGIKHLNWKSHAISEFIQQSMSLVKELDQILKAIKQNVADTQVVLKGWADNLMMDRKTAKTYTIEEFNQTHQTLTANRKKAIEKGGEELHQHLDKSNKELAVNRGKAEWLAYVDYVNQIIVEGLVAACVRSAKYLQNQIDKEEITSQELAPLLEISMRLTNQTVMFEPPMGRAANGKGIRNIVGDWLGSMVNISTLVMRVDTPEEDGDYLLDLFEDPAVRAVTAQINRHLEINERECEDFRQEFMQYSYLWCSDINEVFDKFLKGEEAPENHKWGPLEEGESIPSLAAFEEQIVKYKSLEEQVKELPSSKVIGWLKVDARPVKHQLATQLSKWYYKFLEYLQNRVTESVKDITAFTGEVNDKLDMDVSDQNSLLEVMGFLTQIRRRTEATDAMFQPLHATCSLLKKYNVTVEEEVLEGLEQAPQLWDKLKKKAVVTKEKHSKAQTTEAEKLKKKSKEFEDRVAEYFAYFKKQMPFNYSEKYDESYGVIDRIHHGPKDASNPMGSVRELNQDATRLNNLQELFELYLVEYRECQQCEKEAVLLKELWDMIAMVVDTFSLWRKTKWNDIDVEGLTEGCKSMMKSVKGLNKHVKNWPGFKGLEDAVKNMQTSLPLVHELHHPAMRDRHWKQLMRTTGVSFTMDENFSLGALLALKLHEFEEDVMEIVDKAQKELMIEKQVKKIEDTWKVQNLIFDLQPDGEMSTLRLDDSLMECLEDSVVQLGNLQGNKYVQNNPAFLEQVTNWQRRIGNVDSVLATWMEVQKKWQNLQSIFVGSADIRVQLPEDSKRFDGVDVEFKDLMKEAVNVTNAVEGCNIEGRLEKIETMREMLEKCEKALAEYLETKRVAYPRFYFVAPADLLDILSKGSNPQAILKHLPKCFDNVKTLEFQVDGEGKPTKTAIAMLSGEDEKVQFHEPFVCDGAVEKWLFDLTVHTHECLKTVLFDAVAAYEDKPKHEFVMDWCAQVAGTVSRIIYMEEVNITFEQLEEGNEFAMREYYQKLVDQLKHFVELIKGDLKKIDRMKIVMIVTVDVHARDVVSDLIETKAENNQHFTWMSQLKFSMDEKQHLGKINICDYECVYGYEYIGVCGCLVVTPLTDRCYITLTQAMRLCLGGAPAGPAGTGKTETTKDLGRAMGIMVYVFNCSDQMDYKSMGSIFKGLSQAGAWGCFDEFNRIDISVLSVTSTQWKCILDAIRARKHRFIFEDEDIILNHEPFCSAYITMNPGYAGRTELPESVKALFRPCAMTTPDMDLIAEIMLMSEGYAEGKILARKFMILYRLSEALLSAQRHYDWKLRAVKTTLCVAGGLLRKDKQNSEDRVLLRALRDFNLGKLVADDVGIFMGMLNDLFPKSLDQVPRNRDEAFEERLKEACHNLSLQAEDIFILKCTQLREILEVRWSVFVLGPAGCGKSEMIKTLSKAQNIIKEKTTNNFLNPKSVTRNELYGYIHPATREWKDGLISQIFRDLANTNTDYNNPSVNHQYIVLDGDIDAEWIESMNTVMDDNKTLTLASNERIPLTPTMRLLLEIENMREASPATVSRGGVIFMNDTDVGWAPYIASWVSNREVESEKGQLTKLFDEYMDRCITYIAKNLKTICPLPKINQAMSTCYILHGLLGNGEAFAQHQKQLGPEDGSKLLEHIFIYSCMWGCAGALTTDKSGDMKDQFSKWFRAEFVKIPFPEDGSIFDYMVDQEANCWKHWNDCISPYVPVHNQVFGNIYVNTLETQRLTAILDLVVPNRRAVCFVGGAGTGKTTIMKDKLRNIDQDQFFTLGINFNCFTDSLIAQTAMESVLEKKTGRVFGPPGSKKLIYFIDDLNMPMVDKYGTQQPIALLRQGVDYAAWYDRGKLTLKEVQNIQFLSCMNPTAGSFIIDPRLQRSYMTFSVFMPRVDVLQSIYAQILSGNLSSGGFGGDVVKISDTIVTATVELHAAVVKTFFPTAVKFHYNFNLRETSAIMQGLCRAKSGALNNAVAIVRLWYHECERVFLDRMVTTDDIDKFKEMLSATGKKHFSDLNQEKLNVLPNIWTTFTTPGIDETDRPYCNISEMDKLASIVEDRLKEYNETNATMNLVLFEQALEHICRITRVIDQPRGNALLVGVGGSGKQSLSKLSAFIIGYESYQITVTASYGINDFKENLMTLYQRTGVKGIGTAFILTDSQIVNEKFLVMINDFLASGNIADLMPKEEKDNCSNAVRGEVKQAGIVDTAENCWDFFIEKVRKYLHMVLCFSPVGDAFRVRARQFPALINDTVYDYFHGWSQEALMKVANRFLRDVEAIASIEGLQDSVAQHMAHVHRCVETASVEYFEQERRSNYTTPKSFLDLISLYKNMLAAKKDGIRALRERLENGLEKMNSAAEQVAELQENLVKDMAVVEQKKAATDQLIVVVGQETAVTEEQKAGAAVEEAECTNIQNEVMEFQAQCDKDLAAAEPIIQQAEKALNTLDKKSLTELKSLAAPPAGVDDVTSGVMVLLGGGKIPKDMSWNAAKKMMANVDQFLQTLINFDKDNTPDAACTWCENNVMNKSHFNGETMKSKSGAAAGMCEWVINICKYFRVYQYVEPKRVKLKEANDRLIAANTKLAAVRKQVAELEEKLGELTAQYEAATLEKNEAIAAAEKTQRKASMADRLVNGLADERVRWSNSIETFGIQEKNFIGDVMVSSAFVSYIGAFNSRFRDSLVNEKWITDLVEKKIPMTEGIQPLDLLCDSAMVAGWNTEGLPTDTVSIQNGAIMTNCARWPLMIDPQLQGIKWIKKRHLKTVEVVVAEDEEGNATETREEQREMKVVQQTQDKYLNFLEIAMSQGEPIMIENLGESIDAVMEPVMSKAIIRRGRAMMIKLGDKEVEYDENFKLYLQTKLSNPHYKPEIAAQTTLMNFMITIEGLEEQLLTLVVAKERPDLGEQKTQLIEEQNGFRIKLKELEDGLLFSLSNSQGDILEDIELIEGLELTKITSNDIKEKQELAKTTEQRIAIAMESYRPVAIRGALLYFLVDQLWVLAHIYRFSMANFVYMFKKGMDNADVPEEGDAAPPPPVEGEEGGGEAGGGAKQMSPAELKARVERLIDTSCFTVFSYIAQGLFEKHKLIFASQLCFRVLARKGELDPTMFEFLIRGPKATGDSNPLAEWLDESAWGAISALKNITEPIDYSPLPEEMVSSQKRFRDWYEKERPEEEGLPGDWKKLPEFPKLLIIRALRTDRMGEALSTFVRKEMGEKYVTSLPFSLVRSFDDASPETPVFFILSPGVDPVKDTEELGKSHGISYEAGNLGLVSLGQGQEEVAQKIVETAYKNGGWGFLQNIHLTPAWTGSWLEGRCDDLSTAHEAFRLFLSAEPAALPINILQVCVKLTNEPPDGLKPNLLKAMAPFSDEFFECSKPAELRSIVFMISYFHAIILERKKFGPQGWNRKYPFNSGDLTSCAAVALNYLEANTKIPWDDLRYIFGQIMYGGHVTDGFDRRLVSAYLEEYLKPDLLDGFVIFATPTSSFSTPSNSFNNKQAAEYVQDAFPQESPIAYGLHPNAEINFRKSQAEEMFQSIVELQPRSASGMGGMTVQDRAQAALDEIIERLPDQFVMADIVERIEERSPYVNVFLQEIERMVDLTSEMRRSLSELALGLKGDLQITDVMEKLMQALADNKVPDKWEAKAYPSRRPLNSWLSNLIERQKQLDTWTGELGLPKVTWLSGLFSPQSFLTAVKQTTARRNEWALDRTENQTDVTRFWEPGQVPGLNKEGAYVTGLTMEGARWDEKLASIEESRPKDQFSKMPIILIKAVQADKVETNVYSCPVYKTEDRGPTFVFEAKIKTKHKEGKWIMAGVALLMDVVG